MNRHRHASRVLALAFELCCDIEQNLGIEPHSSVSVGRASLTAQLARLGVHIRAVSHDRVLLRVVEQALRRIVNQGLVPELLPDLHEARWRSGRQLVDLDLPADAPVRATFEIGDHPVQWQQVAPNRPARGLIGMAVLVLPPATRGRYREEFLAELVHLPPWRQPIHALRILGHAWDLRQCLKPRAAERAQRAGG